MYQLCPSILSADFNRLGEQIKTLYMRRHVKILRELLNRSGKQV